MRIDTGFRVSTLLSLSLACLTIGWAEEPFVPELLILVVPAVVVLWIAGALEGRWSLPSWTANLLGAFIAPLASLWIATRLFTTEEHVGTPLTWTSATLPYLGPLLMVLLLVK